MTSAEANGTATAQSGGRASMHRITFREMLHQAFQGAIDRAFPELPHQVAVVAPTGNPKIADYQCNNAMIISGRLPQPPKQPAPPGENGQEKPKLSKAEQKKVKAAEQEARNKLQNKVAQQIIDHLPEQLPMVAGRPATAGGAFINMRVDTGWMGQVVQSMLVDGIQTWAPRLSHKRCVIDFSSPNVAKEMHVGHLRSTILGDTIARTMEYCGLEVVRLNHVGDWGTQFGMLIQYIAESRPGGINDANIENEDLSELQALYQASKKRFDDDAEFKDRAKAAVGRLQGGDPECQQAWQRICQASRQAFQAIYERLGVELTERGESFYNPLLKSLVEEMAEQGVAEDSNGAKVIFVEGHENPLIIQKADGAFLYGTTDLAAIRHRLHVERGDWLIYVTDMGQAGHFELVFGAAKRAGFLPAKDDPSHPRIDHVGFGLVLGADGKRIRTRSGGDIVKLVELLDEAVDRCRATIKERREDIGAEELEMAACAMGYGAIKYADLKNHRTTNYKFDFDAMCDLKGNTAVYLLYAHARISSIVRKANRSEVTDGSLAKTSSLNLEHPSEIAVALHLIRFPEALEDMLADLTPNRLTEYLYILSDKFNTFYKDCHVIGEKEEDSRLLLVQSVAVVMRQCFYLLGLTPLYRI